MLDTIERPSTDKITAPAKRWRNRYLALRDARKYKTGEPFKAGDVYDGDGVWPTREVAEQKYLDERAEILRAAPRLSTEYLGAFPVPE